MIVYKNSNDVSDGFFLWMDGYVALPIESEFDVTVTYYYFTDTDYHIKKDDIASIDISEAQNVRISRFRVADLESNDDRYAGYSITLTVVATEIGVQNISSLDVYLIDGSMYSCPLGDWCFDVDEQDSGLVDAYSSTFASSSATEFVYNYIMEDDCTIEELQYWSDKILEGDVATKGTIIFESEAPFNYIKSKGLVRSNGNEYRFYGLGSYCGILAASNTEVEISFEHNRIE